ncbi:MAG: hypothetical protein WA667_13765 [Candidatus Nitrosopolaris sp.]
MLYNSILANMVNNISSSSKIVTDYAISYCHDTIPFNDTFVIGTIELNVQIGRNKLSITKKVNGIMLNTSYYVAYSRYANAAINKPIIGKKCPTGISGY